MRREGIQNQPVLYVREGFEGPSRLLLDPNPLSADGTVVYAGGQLACVRLRNATSLLRIYSPDGQLQGDVALPSVGSIGGLAAQEQSDELLFIFTSFFERGTIYRYTISSGLLQVYERIEGEVDAGAFVAEQVWYSSLDGTRVSMFIAHRSGLERNGDNPTLLYGYGGFNISITPAFSSTVYHWLERGGVYAVANLRGGGEYGETWHRDGMLERKQNAFDDFIAAAEWLISNGYTSPERLSIQGGSNGLENQLRSALNRYFRTSLWKR